MEALARDQSHCEIGDLMQPANLESEFDLAYRNRTQEHRKHLADSPVAWLKGACDGTCFLDEVEGRWAAEQIAEDEAGLDDWWRAAS